MSRASPIDVPAPAWHRCDHGWISCVDDRHLVGREQPGGDVRGQRERGHAVAVVGRDVDEQDDPALDLEAADQARRLLLRGFRGG